MSEYASTCHLLKIAGATFVIDGEVRKEIEAFLRSTPARSDFIIVETLFGEELTVVGDCVGFICATSLELRARERAYNKAMTDEIPVEER